jgi:hypothetical protein
VFAHRLPCHPRQIRSPLAAGSVGTDRQQRVRLRRCRVVRAVDGILGPKRDVRRTRQEAELFRVVLSLLFTSAAAASARVLSIALFQRWISSGHALCIDVGMAKISQHPDTGAEPSPKFASEAELELAAKLRHQLEERYFEPSPEPLPPNNRPGKTE